ncbi:MAG: hypothetical protein JWP77_756 [Polaromonas sp.]|nr:hypothetical protein [Polaromonas sp.]
MNMPILCGQPRIRGTAFSPGLAVRPAASVYLLPKRTTVARKEKLEKQKQRHQTENSNAHDFPPVLPRDEANLDDDGVMGEADRPEPPLDKPEA